MAKDLSTRRLGVTPCRDSCSPTPSVQRSLSRRSPTTISLSWAEASSESGHREEEAQVVCIGPHRIRTGSANHELQELVDQWVADSVLDLNVGTDVTLE